jgi:hypothetical protein
VTLMLLQSYSGWQVNQPLFWTGTPPASNSTSIDAACGGAGPYFTSRGSDKTWMQVGEDMIHSLGAWIVGLQANASLADVVVGFEVANEPALGFGGMEGPIKQLLTDTVPGLQAAFAAAGLKTNVTVNFIGKGR